MKIERLLFQVNPSEMAKDFMLADAEVWNTWLKRQSGFLNKTSRIVSPGMVELLLFWKSDKDMKRAASKQKEMKIVDSLMKQRYPGNHTLIQSA